MSQLARNLKRPIEKLHTVLLNSKLAIPLLILIGQIRSKILFHTESGHLKLIGEMYDKCHEILLQYVEFINTHMSPSEIAFMLPSIQELCLKYHLEPETAFYISRSTLSLRYVSEK